MTSEATDELTERFFANNNFFGLDPKSVRFFEQGRYPSLLEDGKIAMSRWRSIDFNFLSLFFLFLVN